MSTILLKMNTNVFAGTQFDQDVFESNTNMRNPNQVEVEVVESSYRNVYRTESVDRFYSIKKLLKQKQV